ncbi:hypothetical protein BGW42_006817, partial [Actinomortierella wolfii]
MHVPPDIMHQYSTKSHTQAVKSQEEPVSEAATQIKQEIKPKLTDPSKLSLVRALAWEHPTVTLDIGTLCANAKRAFAQHEVVVETIRRAVREATDVKRRCQEIIGMFLERVFSNGVLLKNEDRELLDYLCPNPNTVIAAKATSGARTTNKAKNSSSANDNNEHNRDDYGLFGPIAPADKTMFPPNLLVRPVTTQLISELKRHYQEGSKAMCIELQQRQHAPPAVPLFDPTGLTTIEEFFWYRHLANGTWRITPVSRSENDFITFPERELGGLFQKSPILQRELRNLIYDQSNNHHANTAEQASRAITQAEVIDDWLPTQPPGVIIERFVAIIPKENLTVRQRGKAGHVAAVKRMTLEEIENHVNGLRDKNFTPSTYCENGYALRGSISTNGHRQRLLAFKLKELQSAQYRRYKDTLLPDRLQSTIAGTDYYLTEVRNVVKNDADVYKYWGCTCDEVSQISYLGIDFGQACVVGACALLPDGKTPKGKRRKKKGKAKRGKRKKGKRRSRKSKHEEQCHVIQQRDNQERSDRPRFFNLAVKQKAVSQPTFKYRRWMETQKSMPTMQDQQSDSNSIEIQQDGSTINSDDTTTTVNKESICSIETAIPPLKGASANVQAYADYQATHKEVLDQFYNGNNFRYKKHKWDAKRARQEEFGRIADSLLRMVGGSIGERRKEDNKVIIGIGLGRFTSKNRLSSLHDSFQGYFVSK